MQEHCFYKVPQSNRRNINMLVLLILLIQWRVAVCTSSPTFEDNMLPTDEEVFSDLINAYRGQPEQEIALNLPTDEQAFNEIRPILQSGKPFYYTGSSSGRFLSSSFPEIDSRGFHESVFDNLDDLYPTSRRGKRYDSSMVSDQNMLDNGFGLYYPVGSFHKSSEYAESPFTPHQFRGKRSLGTQEFLNSKEEAVPRALFASQSHQKYENHTLQDSKIEDFDSVHNVTKRRGLEWKSGDSDGTREKRAILHTTSRLNDVSEKRSKASNELKTFQKQKRSTLNSLNGDNFKDIDPLIDVRYNEPYIDVIGKRVPEIDKGGFHGDVFHNNFGNFHPLKRAPEMGQSGFHGDIFHKSFGDFNTLKRAPEMGQIGFHNDIFHNNFGNFETLRKRKPAVDMKSFNHDAFNRDFGHFDTLRKRKRKISNNAVKYDLNQETGSFDRELGNFYPGKRRPNAGAVNGDAFHSNFGIFETLKKRRPESELIGDAFHRSFGNFNTMKRSTPVDDNAFYSQFEERNLLNQNSPANDFGRINFVNQLEKFNSNQLEPSSQRRLFNNYVETFNKMRPHRFDKLQYVPKIQPQDDTNYEKFRTFFRNYAIADSFDDMAKRLEAPELSLKSVRNDSSFIH